MKTKAERTANRNCQIETLKAEGGQVQNVYDIIIVTYAANMLSHLSPIKEYPAMKAWKENAAKPFANYYYHSEEQRQKAIEGYISSAESRVSGKMERAREQREYQHNYKIGDILHSSWGYDQTNCDFYQVVEVKGKFVTVREIGHKIAETETGNSMADYRVADKDQFLMDAPPLRRKVLKGDVIKINSYQRAYKWDGRECYCSWYA